MKRNNEEIKNLIAKRSFYLKYEDLSNMEKFVYHCEDKSILYNYIISPLLNKIIHIVPLRLAPNLITLCSLIINTISFVMFISIYANDFYTPPSRWVCIIYSVTHFVYILFDNIDGKQARRTKSTSCFGMILDYSTDLISLCYININLSHITSLGNYFISFSLFWANSLVFWTFIYENSVLGMLSLGYINGANEGMFLIQLALILSSILKPSFWHYDVVWIFDIVYMLLLFVAFYSVFTVLASLINIWKVRGFSYVGNYFIDSFLTFSILLFPVLNYMFMLKSFENYFDLIYYLSSLMFIRVGIQLQVDIISDQKFKKKRFYLIFITYLSIIGLLSSSCFVNDFIEDNQNIIKIVFYFFIVINILGLIHFCIDISYSITRFLEIDLFTIKNNVQEPLLVKSDIE